jgi:23S rRNA (cytidine1920-2'-O)/16S rRNA (cytidine1409-2'-O)-methyltransferase
VKDPALHREVLERLRREAPAWGLEVKGVIPSPLLGPKGNKEFFLYGDLLPERTRART